MKTTFIVLMSLWSSIAPAQIGLYQRFGIATPEKLSVGFRVGNDNWKAGIDLGGYNETTDDIQNHAKTFRAVHLLYQHSIDKFPIYFQGNIGGVIIEDSTSWDRIESDYNGSIKNTTESRPLTQRVVSGLRVGFEWEFYEDIYLDMNLGTAFVVWQREQVNFDYEFLSDKNGRSFSYKKIATFPITGQFVSNIGILFKL